MGRALLVTATAASLVALAAVPVAGAFHFPKRPSLGQLEKAARHPIATLKEDAREIPGAGRLDKKLAKKLAKRVERAAG